MYLVMLATNRDDLCVQWYHTKASAVEHAESIVKDSKYLDACLNKALDKVGRDWCDATMVYIVHLGDEIEYDFRDEWEID